MTLENAARATRNAQRETEWKTAQDAEDQKYVLAMDKWRSEYEVASMEFEAKRELEIKEIAELRIVVDPRFQATIDLFLGATQE